MTLVALRTLDADAFGAFTVALAFYFMGIGVSRGIIAEPLAVLHTENREAALRKTVLGAAVLLGMVAVVVGPLISLALSGVTARALLVVSLSMPALLVQDTVRFVFITERRPQQAAMNDTLWGMLVLASLVVGAYLRVSVDIELVMLVWAGSGAIAAVGGVVRLGSVPSLIGGTAWMRSTWPLGVRFAGEFLLSRGSYQIALLAIGWVAGLGAVGSVSGARTLFGPMTVAVLGITAFGIPEASRLARESVQAFRRLVRNVSLGLAILSLAIGSILLLPGIGSSIAGDAWQRIKPLVAVTALALAGRGVIAGITIGLRGLRAARASLISATIGSIGIVVGATTGAIAGGALGATVGLAIANTAGALVYLVALRQTAYEVQITRAS